MTDYTKLKAWIQARRTAIPSPEGWMDPFERGEIFAMKEMLDDLDTWVTAEEDKLEADIHAAYERFHQKYVG